MYEKYIKRAIDFFLALCAIIVLSPFLGIFTVIGAFAMKGNPFFCQLRPGKKGKDGKEKIFMLIKFRTMTCETDDNGQPLPDEQRLTGYGKFLRSTSIDELPELINILKGDMSVVGPRPQLVTDMFFMTDEQRRRHNIRPGLTGLAQISGRNAVSWENKLQLDLDYISDITFSRDLKIVFKTFIKVLKRDGITAEGMDTAEDLGDYLVNTNKIDKESYNRLNKQASDLLYNFR